MTAKQSGSRRPTWLSQAIPGRVFELSRKTYAGTNVLALVTKDPKGPGACPWRGNFLVEVNSSGCVADGARGRARRPVEMIRSNQFGSALVVRRRPELERFDAGDIRLIAYGIKLAYGGRIIERRYGDFIAPAIPGVTWTAFWRQGDPIFLADDASDRMRAMEALRGAWHQEASSDCEGARRMRCQGFITAQDDPRKLAEIRSALKRLGMTMEASVRVAARDEGTHYSIGAGDPPDCPLFSRIRFTTSMTKPGASYDFVAGRYSTLTAA